MININPEFIEEIRKVQKPEYQMALAERDKFLKQIEHQIHEKRRLLVEKRNYLEKSIKENAFLEGVKKDYQKYKDYIVKEKQDQLRAMNILKQYTEDLAVSTKLTEADIKQTRKQQKEILGEMDKIKRELDEIIGPTTAKTE